MIRVEPVWMVRGVRAADGSGRRTTCSSIERRPLPRAVMAAGWSGLLGTPMKAQRAREPRQMIQVGNHQISLPEGITVTDWAIERVHWQNPRIRAFLGCIRLLEGVFES